MFTTIVFLTLGLVAFLSIRDWIQAPRMSIKHTYKIVRESISLNDWERAHNELVPLLESGKIDKTTLLFEIQILQGTDKFEEALKKVEKASRNYPEELLFRLEEGRILLKLGRPKEALAAFKVCAPIMRGESEILLLGTALFNVGEITECLNLIEPWITQTGEFALLAGNAYAAQKQFQKAISCYYRTLESGLQKHSVFVQLGHAYRRLGNLAEAEKIFRKLLEQNPHDIVSTLELGECMQERGHYRKALLIYQTSEAWASGNHELMKQAGICALREEKYALAEGYFKIGIERSTPTSQLFAFYGFSLEGQKKWQQAEQVYLRLIQLFPSDPQGYRALAWLFGVGISTFLSEKEGLNFAYVALKLKNDPVSWEILSACEARVGNFEKAYQIQLSLADHDRSQEARTRRQQALRSLRKNHPLDDNVVIRNLVA